jgi:hypothetical protein
MFQIVEIIPTYHPFTDANNGERVRARSHGYLSEALAHKLAARRWDANYHDCGESSFHVVPFGGNPWRDRIVAPAAATDSDIPY